MLHLKDHLKYLGDFFYRSTVGNEALHKGMKYGDLATSRNKRTLAKQILNVKPGAERYQRTANVFKRQNFDVEQEENNNRLNIVSGQLS